MISQQIYHIDCVILTNNKLLESQYNENQDISVITIASVFSLMIGSFQFVDSISQAYPTIGDYMNTVSIESAENSPAEMEIDPTVEEGMVFYNCGYDNQFDEKRQMYILTKERGNNIYYPNYLPDEVLAEGLRIGRLFKGVFRSNQDNITEGRVNVHV